MITELNNIGLNIRWNVAIETLPDEVLLEIFDLCLYKDEVIDDPWYDCGNDEDERDLYDAWYTLVHVCQRWRYVVFGSPHRLNLQLHCSRRRVRELLCVWPALPVVIWDLSTFESDEDSIIATLEHRDRVCEIRLGGLSEKLVPLMEKSFPALNKLQIESYSSAGDELVLPDSFLGGSAPHLHFLCLERISFPAFPNLLLSASNLVSLYLDGAPSGYIPLEVVAALPALIKLNILYISFRYPNSNSDLEDRSPPPLTRSVLPALNVLELEGDGAYLDDFVARIDVPSMTLLRIKFANRPFFVHDFFHLPRLIGRVEIFRSLDYAGFQISSSSMDVTLRRIRRPRGPCPGTLQLMFLCDIGDPLPSLVEACKTLLPLSNMENFSICTQSSNRDSESGFNTGDPRWLDVLRQFPAAKSLNLGSMDIIIPVAVALKRVIEEGMTGVLPAIQELTVSRSLSAGPVQEAIEQFVTARGLSVSEAYASHKWRISGRS